MDLSVNPLPEKQRKFLKSDSDLFKKNFNKSQYRIDIAGHLDSAIRYFYHILPKSHLLDKEKIYDKINAQTLEDFLKNSLMDIENQGDFRSYSYDFRTIELARLLFEISSDFLKNNPYLKVDDELPAETLRSIKTVSDFYKMLAKNGLQRQSHETIKVKDEKKLELELKEINKKIENKTKSGSEYYKINTEHSKLSDQQITLDNEYHQLQVKQSELEAKLKKPKDQKDKLTLQKDSKINQEKMKENRQKRVPINQQILGLQEKREKILKPLQEKRYQIQEELGNKYKHLESYFCMLQKLPEFSVTYSPHKPKKRSSDWYLNYLCRFL